jgi:hypothetical protein
MTLRETIDREQRRFGFADQADLHAHMLRVLPEADEKTVDEAVSEYWSEHCTCA